MTAARLIIWRHGNTDWNAQRRFQGQADIALNALGRAQARTAASLLAAFEPSALYASDLLRTRETAESLSVVTGLPVVTDPRLREIHVGSWEGLTGDQVAQADPELWSELRQGVDVRRSATGETVPEVGERVAASLREIAEAASDEASVVVTTHGLAARAGIAQLVGLPFAHWRTLGSLDNCAWAVLTWHHGGRRFRIADYNVAGPPAVRETIS